MEKFYRDDDINVYTSVGEFHEIHKVFRKYKRMHTIACEMRNLWYNKGLFWYILQDPLINVELHGWTHERYKNHDLGPLMNELRMARDYWNQHAARMLGKTSVDELPETKKITTFFPPWNQVSSNIEEACKLLKLRLSYKDEDCHWMFHFWATTPKEVAEKLQ